MKTILAVILVLALALSGCKAPVSTNLEPSTTETISESVRVLQDKVDDLFVLVEDQYDIINQLQERVSSLEKQVSRAGLPR